MNRLRIFYSLLGIALLFSSCKDDDDPTASIIGKWQGDRSELRLTYGLIPIQEETDEDFDVQLEFMENGTVSLTRDGVETVGTWELDGRKLETNVDLQFEGVDLSSVTFDVEELTDSRLELHLERDQVVDVPDYGEVTTKVNADLEFNRL